MKTFNFCFNTYKAIGLLLPDVYYEHGGALLRIMWEATLNLAWVAIGPIERSRAFLQFTVVETQRFRRNWVLELEAAGNLAGVVRAKQELADFERTYDSVLAEFRRADAGDAELATAPTYRFVPAAARERINALAGARLPALIISGHVHQQRLIDMAGTRHLWAPTTWAVLPENRQPTLGLKRCGILMIDLEPGGASEPTFIAPDGLRQLSLGDDFPDPYRAHA